MTPIERLTKFLEVTGDESGKTPALTTSGNSEEWVSYADLRAVANIVTQQAREIFTLTRMCNVAEARAMDRDEWKRKAEALESRVEELMISLGAADRASLEQKGRADAFLEALRLVCGVRE